MSLPSAPLFFLSALLPSFSCLPLSLFSLFLLSKNCLFLAGPGLHFCLGFSLVVVSRGSSLVLVRGLLITVASFVSEHGLWGAQASGLAAASLWSTGSIVAARRLSRSAACRVFPIGDQTHVSCNGRGILYLGATGEAPLFLLCLKSKYGSYSTYSHPSSAFFPLNNIL